MPKASSPRVRPTKQRRGQRTLERIVRTTEELLSEEGADATTLKAVMDRAAVGPGSFYHRFESRDALLDYVQERLWASWLEDWEAFVEDPRLAASDPLTSLGEMVRRLVRGHVKHEARFRASLVHALREPAGLAMERALDLDDALFTRLGAVLWRHGLPEATVRVVLLQITGALRSLVLFPDVSPLPDGFGERALILELTGAAARALGLEGAPLSYADLLRRSATLYRRA